MGFFDAFKKKPKPEPVKPAPAPVTQEAEHKFVLPKFKSQSKRKLNNGKQYPPKQNS